MHLSVEMVSSITLDPYSIIKSLMEVCFTFLKIGLPPRPTELDLGGVACWSVTFVGKKEEKGVETLSPVSAIQTVPDPTRRPRTWDDKFVVRFAVQSGPK